MNQDVLQPILSMDVYNRTGSDGTPQNLVLPAGNRLGNLTVLTGVGGVSEDRSSGFFAQAYQDIAGQKIISYRGTDTPALGELGWDIAFGWRMGAGDYSAAQAERRYGDSALNSLSRL